MAAYDPTDDDGATEDDDTELDTTDYGRKQKAKLVDEAISDQQFVGGLVPKKRKPTSPKRKPRGR